MPREKVYLGEYLENYMNDDFLISDSKSENTISSYLTSILFFLEYSSKKLKKLSSRIKASDLTFDLIHNFMIDSAKKNGWSNSTWNVRLAGMLSFVSYLALKNIRFLELHRRVSLIGYRSIKKCEVDYLTEDEVIPLVSGTCKNLLDLRDKAIVLFLFRSGLRVEELVNLKWSNIESINSRVLAVKVVNGKGGKNRDVPLVDKDIIDILKRMRGIQEMTTGFIFRTRENTKMSTHNVRRIVKKVLKSVAKNRKIYPHVLRHSAAMHWLIQGKDIFLISSLLGHSKVATTQKYVRSRFDIKVRELERLENQQSKFTTKFTSNDDLIASLNLKITSLRK